MPVPAFLQASLLSSFQQEALSSTRRETSHDCNIRLLLCQADSQFLQDQGQNPPLCLHPSWCDTGNPVSHIQVISGGSVSCGSVFRLRVLQPFTTSSKLDWVRNRFSDPMPASSALKKRSLFKTTRSSPCARSQQTGQRGSDMEFRWGLHSGKNLCTSRGSLGWLVSPCLMFHRKQNRPECPRHEPQTRHLTGNRKSCVYKNSAKWWKNYKTYQGWNLFFFYGIAL